MEKQQIPILWSLVWPDRSPGYGLPHSRQAKLSLYHPKQHCVFDSFHYGESKSYFNFRGFPGKGVLLDPYCCIKAAACNFTVGMSLPTWWVSHTQELFTIREHLSSPPIMYDFRAGIFFYFLWFVIWFVCLRSVYCAQCCIFLCIVHSCLPLRFSLTFIRHNIDMLTYLPKKYWRLNTSINILTLVRAPIVFWRIKGFQTTTQCPMFHRWDRYNVLCFTPTKTSSSHDITQYLLKSHDKPRYKSISTQKSR